MTGSSQAEQRALWLASRKQGLGGSDLGAIMGLSAYKTPYEVWLDKTGQKTDDGETLQMRFGTYAEDFVAQEYSRITGRKVQRYTTMCKHPSAPIIGNVDRLVIPEGQKKASHQREIRTDLGLECKTANAFAAMDADEWGKSGTDEIPMSYYVQCAAYMALTGCNYWDLAVLFGNQEVRVYHLKRDQELEQTLISRASLWWQRHIVEGIPPEPTTEAEAKQRWPSHSSGKEIELTGDQAQAFDEFYRLKSEADVLDERIKALRDSIFPVLADAEIITFQGRKLATYKANKDSQKTDWKSIATALDANQPLIDLYTTTTPGARVLRLVKQKD